MARSWHWTTDSAAVLGETGSQHRNLDWIDEIRARPHSVTHFSLIVGVEGAIQHAGATMSNHWICPDGKVDVVWNDAPDTPPPGLFVSFASLKDLGGALGGVLVAASVDAKLFRQRPK